MTHHGCVHPFKSEPRTLLCDLLSGSEARQCKGKQRSTKACKEDRVSDFSHAAFEVTMRQSENIPLNIRLFVRLTYATTALSMPADLNLTLQKKPPCFTNHLFVVFHSLSGFASSISKFLNSCGMSFAISRRLIFLPMQVREPMPNCSPSIIYQNFSRESSLR